MKKEKTTKKFNFALFTSILLVIFICIGLTFQFLAIYDKLANINGIVLSITYWIMFLIGLCIVVGFGTIIVRWYSKHPPVKKVKKNKTI